MRYRGRFAPSPTGDLHLGGARTALAAWLAARAAGGTLILRMEDLDRPRVVAGAAQRILADLRALGIDWDEGPDVSAEPARYVQSEGAARYAAALARLDAAGLVYPCYCSRAEIARAASAPHAGEEGPRYPGTCLTLTSVERAARERSGRPPAMRFRVTPGEVRFDDAVHGEVAFDPWAECGDFVVRRADGLFAYQLAVVVDDAAMAISEVVRGDDLLPSTARQLLLYRALALAPPRFAHVPLVLGPDGQRLGKRHGAISIRQWIAAGIAPERILGLLARSLFEAEIEPLHRAGDLIPRFSFGAIRRTPAVIDPASLLP